MGAQQRKNYAKCVLTSVRKGRQDRLALSRVGVSPERAPPDLLPARENRERQGFARTTKGKNKNMKTPHVNLIPQSPLRLGFVLIPLVVGCFALSPAALAVTPAREGGYPNQNTAQDDDALFSLTTGAANTAMGFDVLDSNTTGSDNALASWSWRVTHSLNTARSGHTATLLQNGMVLVAGGTDSNFNRSASAELYDLASGTWTATGSLNRAHNMHTATLLNGRVLVAGGVDSNIIFISATAELYHPASGTWTVTGSLNTARAGHTATLLQNGMVLVAGGVDSNFVPSASAELYDLASGTWTATGSLNRAHNMHTATLLNGRVLVAGGVDSNIIFISATAELYHPASGTWTVTGSLNTARAGHTATLLQNGKFVLVAGGEDSNFDPSASAELGHGHR